VPFSAKARKCHLGENAAAAAKFEKVRIVTEHGERWLHGIDDASREQFTKLRRGDEITRFAKLGLACAVVAQPWRIQATLHVLREGHWTMRGDLFAQVLQQALRMREFVCSGFRQA
jgi:hypothetical protein